MSLIHQDVFDPYYAGREKSVERRGEERTPAERKSPQRPDQIVLPEEAPPHIPSVRRERRAIEH